VVAVALVAAGVARLAAAAAVSAVGSEAVAGGARRLAPPARLAAALLRRGPGAAARAVALAAIAAALAASLPPRSRDLLRGDQVELAAESSWSHGWSGAASWLRIESLLTGAPAVAAGTPVAVVRLESAGRVVDRLVLRAGHETGEWAADRPGLRGRAAAAPPAISWVAPDGESFGHAYRTVWRRAGGDVDRVVVARAAELPPEATLVVRRLEVAR
jgi:hypothetical protein